MNYPLPFQLDFDKQESSLTGFAGIPLVCELWKKLKLDRKFKNILNFKQKGFAEADIVKILVCLFIAGGECVDDLILLKQDKALQKLIKSDIPSSSTVLRFLKSFHTPYKPTVGKSFVPHENTALYHLGFVCRRLVTQAIERSNLKTITIENDATAIESHKQESLFGYKGQGYMPTIGAIPEIDMVLCDEFRDGNVTPCFRAIEFFKMCLRVIPSKVQKVRTRLDGAYYQHKLIDFLYDHKIAFTITAKKSDSIIEFIEALKESEWQSLKDYDGIDTGKDFTSLYYTSAEGSQEEMAHRCHRYLVTRKREVQIPLEGILTKEEQHEQKLARYEVIVTSDEVLPADKLIRFHYKRGGHIEKIHDRIKNDLAGSYMPCGEFGANAAWFRLNCLAFNLIRILQIEALPKKFQNCYLKKLRLWLLNIPGRVVSTGHQITLKLTRGVELFRIYAQAREFIRALEVPS